MHLSNFPRPALASAIISYLIGAPCRVGLHRFNSETPYRGNLLTHRVQYNPYLHTAKMYLLLVKALEMDQQDLPLPTSTLIITGTASERESGRSICREIASPRVFNLAGETTMKELLTLYTMADVLVTNDSGPGHFASLTDVHNIVLLGPETPRLFGAIGGNHHCLSASLACSPCVNVYNHRFSPCKNNRCMEAISVDRVLNVIKKCIG